MPLIQVIWINTHIYFLIGPGILFLFLLESFYKNISFRNIKKIIIAFLLVILVLFLNPFGLEGIIYPFKVFENFGYRPIENQSIWFLGNLKHFYNININLFKIAFLLSLLSFVGVFFKDYKKINITYLILWLGLSYLSWTAIRNFAIFSLFSLPIISYNLNMIFQINKNSNEDKSWLTNFSYLIIGFLIVITFIFTYYNTIKKDFGISLKENNNASINFFKNNNIKGPILNNYDIGGYLIYNLFPEERVFVDNRPESYPNTFFKDVYIPLQNNKKDWQQFKEKYNFNVIFFSYKDATPWAQKFLINRVNDDNWIPVFVDETVIIFLKNNKKNKDIIDTYKLPRSIFNVISYK